MIDTTEINESSIPTERNDLSNPQNPSSSHTEQSAHPTENKNNSQVLPNHTLYINNLNEKIKIDELKQSLYHLFSQFGDIVEIHARKSFKMKGQAFIVFRDVTSSSNAKHALNGAMLYGKPLSVNFSRNISDVILKGSTGYSHKDKVKLDQERRKRREQEYQELKKTHGGGVNANALKNERKNIKEKVGGVQEQNLPNNTLFVESLPQDITEPILRTVFSKYGGFREVRLFEGKGIAFVEYDSEVTAGGALLGLNGLPLTSDCVLKITFAKK